ncbi:MAG: HEPN domain-containing protein [Thermodesulfobacteriota bacterium]|nr:HEPN domain-containing protein [Thermodesulfobacteriota bacterium]
MTKEDHIRYWRESARHDLEVAVDIFNAGKYDWCLFVGHLALEKIIKAVYVDRNDNMIPPKSHNLVRLAELSDIEMEDEKKLSLDKIKELFSWFNSLLT